MNLFKSEFFGLEIIINYLRSLKYLVHNVAFQLQNHLIFEKVYCAFLQLITSIVSMSARSPKMDTLGTYYNIIDSYSYNDA